MVTPDRSYPLRLPTELYERVRREAAARERSANWVMVRLLRRALDESPEWLARALE